MKSKKITQEDLCKQLGITQSNFSQWKSGKTTSYKKKLPEIAKILGVSTAYLLGEEDISGKDDLYRKYNQAPENIKEGIKKILGIE